MLIGTGQNHNPRCEKKGPARELYALCDKELDRFAVQLCSLLQSQDSPDLAQRGLRFHVTEHVHEDGVPLWQLPLAISKMITLSCKSVARPIMSKRRLCRIVPAVSASSLAYNQSDCQPHCNRIIRMWIPAWPQHSVTDVLTMFRTVDSTCTWTMRAIVSIKANGRRGHHTLLISLATSWRLAMSWLPRIFALPPPADGPDPLLFDVKTHLDDEPESPRSGTSHSAESGRGARESVRVNECAVAIDENELILDRKKETQGEVQWSRR